MLRGGCGHWPCHKIASGSLTEDAMQGRRLVPGRRLFVSARRCFEELKCDENRYILYIFFLDTRLAQVYKLDLRRVPYKDLNLT